MRAPAIRGTRATLLLPIAENEEIDFARLRDEIDILIRTPVDGIYTNGTAGEFYAQSEDEFDRIHGLLAGRCRTAGKPFQVGASHMSPQISLERVRRARDFQPDAIQVILPGWWPVSLDEAGAFLERVPSLAGVKVAGGDAAWYAAMKACAPDFSLFVPGHRLAKGIAQGAHGSYSNVALPAASRGQALERYHGRRSAASAGSGMPHPRIYG
jgi:dihydrodipicolinate synthase/N-acetylneuraminate lyase